MDIDIIIACGDGVIELRAVLQFLFIEYMQTFDHAALAHADLRCAERDIGIFKALDVLLQEVIHLKHLLARFHFGAAERWELFNCIGYVICHFGRSFRSAKMHLLLLYITFSKKSREKSVDDGKALTNNIIYDTMKP